MAKKKGAWAKVDKALDTALKVKRLLNVERKFVDAAGTGTVTSAGVVIPLTLLGTGTGDQARTGVSVKAYSNVMRLTISNNPASVLNNSRVRVIMFKDTQTNGVLPTVTEVLESADPQSPMKNSNLPRFKKFYDKFHYVSQNDNNNSQHVVSKKFEHHIGYTGTNNTIAELIKGGLFMLLIGEATVNQPAYKYINRFKFIDN